MLPYTEAEKQAWLSDEKTLSLSFSDNTTVDYTSIISESMEITYSLCSDNELRWGKCNPTQFKISLTASNKNYKGLYVTPTLICGQYSQVIGTFLVVEDEKEADSTIHTLTCYDKLYEINNTDYAAWYNAINWSSITTIGAFRNAFFSHIGLTQVTEGTFYSDSISINKPIAECTSLTGETILNAILELEGCFGRILPDGRFKHEYIEVYVEDIYPSEDLYPSTDLYPVEGNVIRYLQGDIYMNSLSYANYQTDKISHLIIRADADDIGGSASVTSTTENTYIMQGNFLMTGQSSTVLNNMASWLLDRLKDYYLYPGSFDVQGRPWIEVGDSVFGQGLVDMVQFPILELTRKGINGLVDTYKAQHIKNYDEQLTSVPSSVIELNGKTNKLTRTVEETRSLITDPETGLQTQITQNAGAITAEVRRATEAEGQISAQISVTAGEIKQEVAGAQKTWDTSNYNISISGYGDPTTEGIAPGPYINGYYLNQSNGAIYYSNGSTWTYIATVNSIEQEIRGELSVKIDNDDDGTIVSLITGSANKIAFNASNLFTVTSPYFNVDNYGYISAVGASLNDRVYFNAFNPYTGQYDDEIGYIGVVNYGLGSGFGLRNHSNTVGVVMPDGTSYDWLWMGANNKSMAFTGDTLQPWSSGVDLGSSYHKWDWVVCDNISCTNAPWSSSDKRMKNTKGTISKVRDFYMALKPLQYTFKKGVDNENPEKMHYGLIAQDVLNTYEKCYNTDKQGLVRKESIKYEEGTQKVIKDTEKYTINYNELHAFHIQMIQDLTKEVEALKAEIDELRKEIKHE